MTAIGFSLFFVGFVIFRYFGASRSDAYIGRLDPLDYISIPMTVIGFILLVVGVAKWLWKVMP